MTTVRTVLVVGGGIGGLCTAVALRRQGVEVDVVERNPDWDVYGVGIIQPSNALRALGDLGLAQACLDQGFGFPGHQFHDRDGNPLAEPLDFPLPPGAPGPAVNGITRPRLHRILQQATIDAGARVRTGVTFTEIDDSGAAVSVAFTDGERGDYDLVVAADGIHSSVRDLFFDSAPQPEWVGQLCWRYNVPRPPEVTRLEMFVGPNGKAGLVPLSDDLMYVLLIETPPPGMPVPPPKDGLAALMRERLADYGGELGRARDRHMHDDDAVVVRAVETVIVPAPWHRGRVLLIGDAAHATSPQAGQGAAQAIEDAVVLGEEIARGDDLPVTLDRFMQRRYERCKLVVEGSLQISHWEQANEHEEDAIAMVGQISAAVAAPL